MGGRGVLFFFFSKGEGRGGGLVKVGVGLGTWARRCCAFRRRPNSEQAETLEVKMEKRASNAPKIAL